MLQLLDERGYAYDMVRYTLRGGHRDNAPPTLRHAYLAKEWNDRWAYPRLITSNSAPFLRRFESRFGHSVKSLRGELPNTDYTMAATCTPRETAVNRNTHDRLLTAEKLATLASLVAGHEYPRATLDEAYKNTLYYDLHCWGMSHPGGPAQDGCWSQKSGFAYKAAALAYDVAVKAGNRIVDAISYPDEGYYLTVFNPLSWERSDVVRVPLRDWQPSSTPMHWEEPEYEGEGPRLVSSPVFGRQAVAPCPTLLEEPFQVVDAETGESLPYQIARLTDPQAALPWAPERYAMGKIDPRHLIEIVFLTKDLPSVGYRTYRITPCETWPQAAPECSVGEHEIANRFFKLAWDADSGALASLVDKELGRELIDQDAAHGFARIIARWSETGQVDEGRVTGVSVSSTGPLYTTLRLTGEVSGCPRWTQEITLYHQAKRIDVGARILRDSTPLLELYIGFPFRVEEPQFRFEGTDSVIEPTVDQLPGSNTDYYAMQHWADVYNDSWGVVWAPIDAPMVEFGGLWPGYVSGAHHGVTPAGYGHPFLRPGELRKGHIYSPVMYSNFRTNFINVHAGEMLLRYSFSTHEGDWRAGRAREFGWGVANPPLAVWMKGPKDGSLPSAASFCHIDAPNIMLLTLKRAEDGNGLILRLIETEGKEIETRVSLPTLPILQAYETDLVERDQRLLPCACHTVSVTLEPFAIRTLRLVTRQDSEWP